MASRRRSRHLLVGRDLPLCASLGFLSHPLRQSLRQHVARIPQIVPEEIIYSRLLGLNVLHSPQQLAKYIQPRPQHLVAAIGAYDLVP